jgi:voltage-gated potassium channel
MAEAAAVADTPAGQEETGVLLAEDPSGRLLRYVRRTQAPLDVLALATLWVVVVPPGDFGSPAAARVAWLARGVLSAIYAVDIVVRTALARHHWQYLRHHPLGILVVFFPPLRVLLSLRLIRSVFRRGQTLRFLIAAAMLVLDGAAIVYFFEHVAPGANIRTFGDAVWWAATTVTTVGYGDYTPVTLAGRITAVFVMAVAILTLAVVTAQVAASFVTQGEAESAGDASSTPPVDLDQRLARIEALIEARGPEVPPAG